MTIILAVCVSVLALSHLSLSHRIRMLERSTYRVYTVTRNASQAAPAPGAAPQPPASS